STRWLGTRDEVVGGLRRGSSIASTRYFGGRYEEPRYLRRDGSEPVTRRAARFEGTFAQGKCRAAGYKGASMGTLRARGVVVRAPGARATVEDLVIDPPGAGEVLVRILATGICHSDLHTKQGNFGVEFPYLLGHEATGVIEAVGV